jgi:hypothetical protein
MKGIFVPIVSRTALYVGAKGEAFTGVTVGEPISVSLPSQGLTAEQVKVTSPTGREEFVPVRRYPSGSSLSFDHTDAPGIYTVSNGTKDIALFTANMGSGESDLTPMSEERLRAVIAAKMLQPANLKILAPSGGDFGRAITESRYGLELWKYMLALALICAFAEMVVGRAAKEA